VSDDDISVEGQDSEQDELDNLLSQGKPLPEGGSEYSTLYRYLGSSEARLPSNFPDRVLQRILRIKIERARSAAIFQSGLIGMLALIVGAGLITFSAHYLGSQDLFRFSAQTIQALILPGLGASVLLLLLMLDSILALTHQAHNKAD